jgi:hypothetical protein
MRGNQCPRVLKPDDCGTRLYKTKLTIVLKLDKRPRAENQKSHLVGGRGSSGHSQKRFSERVEIAFEQ